MQASKVAPPHASSGVVTDVVHSFQDREHFLGGHPRGNQRLVRITQNRFGNFYLTHFNHTILSLLKSPITPSKEHTGGNCRPDDARHVGTHGVHEQEVGGVILLSLKLGDARRHRHGRHAGRTDERVDGTAADDIHELCGQQSATGGDREGQPAPAPR